ncbi:hypothetical protein DMUE_2715 [Dictyocoela muelleri]|nr:hypothetical protein DMUE_2715 [Dictyocoela muelleri]
MNNDYNEQKNIERTLYNNNMSVEGGRKVRQAVSRNMIECFLNLLQREVSLSDIDPILDVSRKTVNRLYTRYLNGEFSDLNDFKSAGEKRKKSKKDISFEKNLIASEISVSPCISQKSIA